MVPLLPNPLQADLDAIVATVPGGALNVQDIYPLAPLQEGLLFHHLMDGAQDTYVLPMVFAAESRGQVNAFLKALQQVLDRHDILRTAVLWQGLPSPVQVVWRQAVLPVRELPCLTDAQTGNPGAAIDALLAQQGPLSLETAPLARAFVVPPRTGASLSQWHIAIQMHHLVCDHVSQQVMLDELRACLSAATDGANDQAQQGLLPPTPYRAFVAQALTARARQSSAEYFAQQLGDVDSPTLPFGLSDVQSNAQDIEQDRQHLDAALSQSLREQARQLGVSAAALFHAAWALVVGQCSGRDDVVFGSVLSGRLQGAAGVPGADRALGMFINTLPLRMRLPGDASARVNCWPCYRMNRPLWPTPCATAPCPLARHCSAQ
jgi:hypothetical protein